MSRELSTGLAQFSYPARDVGEVLVGICSRIDVDAWGVQILRLEDARVFW
jgi:hypothetical protein